MISIQNDERISGEERGAGRNTNEKLKNYKIELGTLKDRVTLICILLSYSYFYSPVRFSAQPHPNSTRQRRTALHSPNRIPLSSISKFNIQRSPDDKTVRLILNRFSGSGIISSDYYNHGFFSASIRMPSKYTAGIVVAFYTSNVDTFEKNHDELDIEFLGNVQGKPWRFQTNVYGNGSVSRGREERYRMWFDPSKDSHRYSILWTPKNIIFYVDDVPIREVIRHVGMGGDFPSKPMSVYATIWDASSWATSGGKKKVDYRYEPFVAELNDLVLRGCVVDLNDQVPSTNCSGDIGRIMAGDYTAISPEGRRSMRLFRQRHMYYSYCYDRVRYSVPPPECVIVPWETDIFRGSGGRGRIRVAGNSRRRRRPKRRREVGH